MNEWFSTNLPIRVVPLRSKFTAAMSVLRGTELPTTLQPNDVHPGNAGRGPDGRLRLFDLGDAFRSHPWAVLSAPLRTAGGTRLRDPLPDTATVRRLLDRYAERHGLAPHDERTRTASEIIATLRTRLQEVPGIAVYLQPVQDLTIEDRVSRTQFQFIMEDPDATRLSEWVPKLVERLHRLLLDVIKDEFERLGQDDLTPVQGLLLYILGGAEGGGQAGRDGEECNPHERHPRLTRRFGPGPNIVLQAGLSI